ncbi:MAG: hypothetical protein ABWK01_01430 [Infirmifilum sp.]
MNMVELRGVWKAFWKVSVLESIDIAIPRERRAAPALAARLGLRFRLLGARSFLEAG